MAKSQHTEEFKAQILKEVKEIHNVAFVARKHNIPAHRIRHWIKKAEPVTDLQKEKTKNKEGKLNTKNCNNYGNRTLAPQMCEYNDIVKWQLRQGNCSRGIRGGKLVVVLMGEKKKKSPRCASMR